MPACLPSCNNPLKPAPTILPAIIKDIYSAPVTLTAEERDTYLFIQYPVEEIMPRPEKMTIKTQEALSAAVNEAVSRKNGSIEPEHLLLALLDQEGGIVTPLLQRIGADTARSERNWQRRSADSRR